MIRALLVGLAALAAGERAFVEVESARTEYYLGEAIPVRLRVGLDERFLRENAVPLTLRKVGAPVLVEAAWLRGPAPAPGGTTLALNDGIVEARRGPDRIRGGSTFTVLEIEGTLRPDRAGDLVLTAPVLRYAHASRFEEDALGIRVALDREESSVAGAALTLRILPVPAEGRPPGFSGGVGRFTIAAACSPTEVEAGKAVRLVLRVEGEGDLAAVSPPRLDGLAGFHVLGRLDGTDASGRTFTYDLAPLSAQVTEVPPIPLDFFDPAPPAGWRVARTAAIPLRVRPGTPVAAPPPREGGKALPLALVLAAAVVSLALLLRRRSRPGAGDPVVAAAAAFRARDPVVDLADALIGFLAESLACPPAAVVSPDLGARLERAGVPADLAARTARFLEGLLAARYGGGAPSGDPGAAALDLVEGLASALRRAP